MNELNNEFETEELNINYLLIDRCLGKPWWGLACLSFGLAMFLVGVNQLLSVHFDTKLNLLVEVLMGIVGFLMFVFAGISIASLVAIALGRNLPPVRYKY